MAMLGSGCSSGTASSEGRDHLAEMREKLLSSEGSSSGEASRSGSGSGEESATDPAAISKDPAEAASSSAEPSRRRRSSATPLEPEEGIELPLVQAWDSVVSASVCPKSRANLEQWSAPDGLYRHASTESCPSRFPIAPLSPFHTPAFAPSLKSGQARSPRQRDEALPLRIEDRHPHHSESHLAPDDHRSSDRSPVRRNRSLPEGEVPSSPTVLCSPSIF